MTIATDPTVLMLVPAKDDGGNNDGASICVVSRHMKKDTEIINK